MGRLLTSYDPFRSLGRVGELTDIQYGETRFSPYLDYLRADLHNEKARMFANRVPNVKNTVVTYGEAVDKLSPLPLTWEGVNGIFLQSDGTDFSPYLENCRADFHSQMTKMNPNNVWNVNNSVITYGEAVDKLSTPPTSF